MADPASGAGDFAQWIVTFGMTVGAGIAGAIMRGAWKAEPAQAREFTMTGQAQITDMGPIRDLVKQAESFAPKIDKAILAFEMIGHQQSRNAEQIGELVVMVREYIEDQKAERENDDAYKRGRDDAMRENQARPRARRKVAPVKAG